MAASFSPPGIGWLFADLVGPVTEQGHAVRLEGNLLRGRLNLRDDFLFATLDESGNLLARDSSSASSSGLGPFGLKRAFSLAKNDSGDAGDAPPANPCSKASSARGGQRSGEPVLQHAQQLQVRPVGERPLHCGGHIDPDLRHVPKLLTGQNRSWSSSFTPKPGGEIAIQKRNDRFDRLAAFGG